MRISVVGNIACGKSSVMARLPSFLPRLAVYPEPVEDWGECLDLFYADPARWSLTFNLRALLSFRCDGTSAAVSVYERSPLCCRHVFFEAQCDDGHMTHDESRLYRDMYGAIGWTPDALVYVRTPPETCLDRMRRRGRACENGVGGGISLEYLRRIHDKYETMVSSCSVPCIVIDGDRDGERVTNDVVAAINTLQFTYRTRALDVSE
jgi:deoxyadenosine/deoxycytidine kinase